MEEGVHRAGGLFRNEFLDKGLVTFWDCSKHYAAFEADDLVAEMRLLFSPPMLALPFGVSGTRYLALMDALVNCAGNKRDMTDRERSKLVNICIDVCTYVRSRTADARRDAFNQALSTTLDRVSAHGGFPRVADLIALGTRDYAGSYEPKPAPVVPSRHTVERTVPVLVGGTAVPSRQRPSQTATPRRGSFAGR